MSTSQYLLDNIDVDINCDHIYYWSKNNTFICINYLPFHIKSLHISMHRVIYGNIIPVDYLAGNIIGILGAGVVKVYDKWRQWKWAPPYTTCDKYIINSDVNCYVINGPDTGKIYATYSRLYSWKYNII